LGLLFRAVRDEETPGGAIAAVDRFHNDPVVKWADIHAETSTWEQAVLV